MKSFHGFKNFLDDSVKQKNKKEDFYEKNLSKVLAVALMVSLLAGCASSRGGGSSSADGQSETQEITWPDKPVSVYIPASPGGSTDLTGRVVMQGLQNSLGQPFNVINQSDGGGVVAMETVRNADPDGYTLLYYHSSFYPAVYSGVYDKDPNTDFKPIIAFKDLNSTQALVANLDAPYDTLDEFIEYAKANPGTVKWGVLTGGSTHFMAGIFEKGAGIDINIVDAGTQADMITGVLGGHLDVTLTGANKAREYLDSGDMKVLAVMTADGKPSELLPDVELATDKYPDVGIIPGSWIIYGPKDMDEELVQKINQEVMAVVEDEDTIQQFADSGYLFENYDVDETMEYLTELSDMVKGVAAELGY